MICLTVNTELYVCKWSLVLTDGKDSSDLILTTIPDDEYRRYRCSVDAKMQSQSELIPVDPEPLAGCAWVSSVRRCPFQKEFAEVARHA